MSIQPANWPKDRCNELRNLCALLNDCKDINHATGVIERLRRIEDIAEMLTKADAVTPRASFLDFLLVEATKKET